MRCIKFPQRIITGYQRGSDSVKLSENKRIGSELGWRESEPQLTLIVFLSLLKTCLDCPTGVFIFK